MKRSDELKQQRGAKMDELTAISTQAANAMLTEEQRSNALRLKGEIEHLDTDIQLAEAAEAEQARQAVTVSRAKQPQASPEQKATER